MWQRQTARHTLYLKASGERKQMGQQENKMGRDKKGMKRGLGIVCSPTAAGRNPTSAWVWFSLYIAQTQRMIPSPEHCAFSNTESGRQKRERVTCCRV